MKSIFLEKPLEDRIKALEEHAVKVVPKFSWDKKLDETDLENFRIQFAEKNIELTHLQDDLKSYMQIAKAGMKPVQEDIHKLQTAIEHRELNIVETVYCLPDQIGGEMEYYNDEGLCVYSRPLRPEERQFTIRPSARTS